MHDFNIFMWVSVMSFFITGALMSSSFGFLALECYGERDVLLLCCAFSAVLSGFGHSLPCEAWRENASHGVIMSNPPPHTQPPFSPIIFSPLLGWWQPHHAHFFIRPKLKV